MNKETLTLLERCQREARETNERHHRASYGHILPEESLEKAITYWNERTDTLITNTLKQAAEAIEVMVKNNKDPYMFPLTERRFLTDAQKMLGVDLSE